MRKFLLAFALATIAVPAVADEAIVLRGMGSFHVGGRVVEVTGKPVKEVVFSPGGVPAKMRQIGLDYADAVRAGGGKVDVVNLPEVGIKGNSHMLMMDKNNKAIADLIGDWLKRQGLSDD